MLFRSNLHRYTCVPHPEPSSLLPPHTLPSGSSQCTSPKHPVLCIEPGLATRFIYDIIHVSMPCSEIIPPSHSPTESKRLRSVISEGHSQTNDSAERERSREIMTFLSLFLTHIVCWGSPLAKPAGTRGHPALFICCIPVSLQAESWVEKVGEWMGGKIGTDTQ